MLLAGAVTVLYGGIQLDGGIVTQASRGASPVADDRLTFPWDGASAVATTLTWGLSQLLFVVALVLFARSGATGPGRSLVPMDWVTTSHLVAVVEFREEQRSYLRFSWRIWLSLASGASASCRQRTRRPSHARRDARPQGFGLTSGSPHLIDCGLLAQGNKPGNHFGNMREQ